MNGWTAADIEKLKSLGRVVSKDDRHGNHIATLLGKVKNKMKHDESDLQIRCVYAFRLMYPKLKMRLFAIPNGGFRSAIEAAIMRDEGVLPGVLDLFLSLPKKEFGGLYIEMKTDKGRLSNYQADFIKEMEGDYKCVVCRSVEDFLIAVKEYLEPINIRY